MERRRGLCGRCGTSLHGGVRFCPACGQLRAGPDRPLMVDLESAAPPVALAQTVVVVSTPPGRRWTVALVVAVAVGVSAVFVAGGLDDAHRETAPVSPTTTVLAGAPPLVDQTTPVTSASAPGPSATDTTASSPTAIGTAPVDEVPVAASAVSYVNERAGPVLDGAQSDQSVFWTTGGRLWRIDLGTGNVTWRHSGGDYYVIGVLEGRVILAGNGIATVSTDFHGDLSGIETHVTSPLAVTDSIWSTSADESGGYRVQRLDVQGRIWAEYPLPKGTYPSGVLGDRVVISLHGRTWLVSPGGNVTAYAMGSAVAVGNGWLLWAGCDEHARCTYRLGSTTTNDTEQSGLETFTMSPGNDGGMVAAAAMAPDGRSVISRTTDRRLAIVDLTTGSVIQLESEYRGSWTTDGDWFVQIAAGGQLVATSARSGQVVHIGVPGLAGSFPATNIVIG